METPTHEVIEAITRNTERLLIRDDTREGHQKVVIRLHQLGGMLELARRLKTPVKFIHQLEDHYNRLRAIERGEE